MSWGGYPGQGYTGHGGGYSQGGGYNQGGEEGYNQGGYGGPPPQQWQQQDYNQGGQYGGPQHRQQGGYNQYPPQRDYNNYQQGGHGGGNYDRHAAPPPHNPQQFGHGAPEGYTFQYSNCTGKRKALLIGINYFGQQGELRGCINDTKNVSSFLMERYNYRSEDMIILTDDQQNPQLQPTKQNILRAMSWLVANAQPDDALFLHYSGHGGQTEDLDGDEEDGTDEVIYPVDFKQAGHIVDDQIHQIVVNPLQAGVRLTAIFDSCHSGSVLDLPYMYSTKGVLKEPNLAAEAGQGLLSAISSYARGDLGGVASSIFGFAKKAYKGDDAYQKTIQTKTSPADVIMWSGSKDDQTSADATIASQATGAMSWAFISAIKQNPQQSYVELLNSIRDVLETKYTQKPQLSCSHPLDTNLLFVM
ncbi:caspase domain-containing protein [Bisporella sp. PMI_857]|nr:caspase domain-containing protein [Bisporella sp. PMI_857]